MPARGGGDATPPPPIIPTSNTSGVLTAGSSYTATQSITGYDATVITHAVVRIDESPENPAATIVGPLMVELYQFVGNSSTPVLLDKGIVYGGTAIDHVGIVGAVPCHDGDRVVAKMTNLSQASVSWHFDLVTAEGRGGPVTQLGFRSAAFCWDSVMSLPNPADPAAGTDWTYTVPAGYLVRLDLLNFMLLNGVGVANRTVHFGIFSGALELMRFPVAADFAAQTASQTDHYEFGVGVPSSDGVDQAFRSTPLVDHLEIPPGLILKSVTASIQGADQMAISWVLKARKV